MANEVGKEILRAFIGVRADSSRVESDIAAARAKAQRAAASGPGGNGSAIMDGLLGGGAAGGSTGATNAAATGIVSRITQTIAGQMQAQGGSFLTTAALGGGVGAGFRAVGTSIVRGIAGGITGAVGAAAGLAVAAAGGTYAYGRIQDSATEIIGKELEGLGGTFEDVKEADKKIRDLQRNVGSLQGPGSLGNRIYSWAKALVTLDSSDTLGAQEERLRQLERQRTASLAKFRQTQDYQVMRGAGMEVTAQFQSIAFNIEAFTRANTLLGRR